MAKVGIVMGSDSDMPVMAKAADILEQLGIEYEMTIISAHREPDVFFEYAKSAESKGFKVIIAGAGMAAHLPYHIFRRKRFSLFYRTDADRYSGSNRCNQWWRKCRNSCSKDSCNIR